MCSNQGDFPCVSVSSKQTAQSSRREICVKCSGKNGPPAVLIRLDDPALCKQCFLAACLHKFKSSFGKSHLFPNQTRVAVGFSGGLASSALLDLLAQYPKCRFQPIVFHIRDSVIPEPEFLRISHILEQSTFPHHFLDPSEINPRISQLQQTLLQHDNTTSPVLVKILPSLLKWCQERMLVSCARSLDCEWLLVGEHGSHLANDLLVGIIEGRSGSSGISVGFIDQRYSDVTILRPLHQFMAKELVFYNRFRNLEPLSPRDPTTAAVLERPNVTTLPRLCEEFLTGLQGRGFPSTTQTVLSTASKLLTLNTADEKAELCRLCMVPIKSTTTVDTSNPNKLALASLEFSHLIVAGSDSSTAANKKETLCYACSNTYNELPDPIKLAFEAAFLDTITVSNS